MLLGFSFSDLLNPKHLFDSISPYGEIGLIAIIFAETGLLLGFFLPGDSLLFTAGLLASQDKLNLAVDSLGRGHLSGRSVVHRPSDFRDCTGCLV